MKNENKVAIFVGVFVGVSSFTLRQIIDAGSIMHILFVGLSALIGAKLGEKIFSN